jgi:putative serine protease PepD
MTGFLVETVEPGSAADKAGLIGGNWPIMWGWAEILIGGDIITHVNGTRIGDMDTAIRMVRSIEVGDRVELTFRRQGEVLTSSVIVEERPVLEQELEIYRHQDR